MINTNDVYRTVLFILNKEQRGYLTPAEFNKVAEQVQLEIFEKYFEDLNQQLRSPQNDSEYGNRVKVIREKIQKFETSSVLQTATSTPLVSGSIKFANPSLLHRIGMIQYEVGALNPVEIELSTQRKVTEMRRSKLTQPSTNNQYYYQQDDNVYCFGGLPPQVNVIDYIMYYIRKPKPPTWEFSLGNMGQYNYTGGQNFELSSIEQTEVVLKILSYAGIIIRDPQIVNQAAQMAAAEDANEKS